MSTPKAGVRVRGTCKDGHTTEATSKPGRVTWNGECATDGCERPVRATRIPADTPPPPDDTRTAGAGEADPYRVREVTHYREEPPAAEHPAGDDGDDNAAGPPPGADGAGSGSGDAGGGTPAPAPPTGTAEHPSPEPRGLFGRAGRRLRRAGREPRSRPVDAGELWDF